MGVLLGIGTAASADGALPRMLELDPDLVADPIPWIAHTENGPAKASRAADAADIELMKWLGVDVDRVVAASRKGSLGGEAAEVIFVNHVGQVGKFGAPEGMGFGLDWSSVPEIYQAILAVRVVSTQAGRRGLLPASLSRVEVLEVIKGEPGWQPKELDVLTWEGRSHVGDTVIEFGHPDEPIRAGDEALLFVPKWQRARKPNQPNLEEGLVVLMRFDFVTPRTLFHSHFHAASAAARDSYLVHVGETLAQHPEPFFGRLGWWIEYFGSAP